MNKSREKLKAAISIITIVAENNELIQATQWMCHRSHLNTHRFFSFKIDNKMIDLMETAMFHSANSSFAVSMFWRAFRLTHSFLYFSSFRQPRMILPGVYVCTVFFTTKYRISSTTTFLLFLVNAKNKRTTAKFSWRPVINPNFCCSSHKWMFVSSLFIFAVPWLIYRQHHVYFITFISFFA